MGQWNNEPDELAWTDERTGMACAIYRIKHSGHLCGYVRIAEGHPLHGVEYSDPIPDALKPFLDSVMDGPIGKRGVIQVFCAAGGITHVDILFDVHGGETFSGDLKDDGGFWYGFDCAHCDDLCPSRGFSLGGEYRDIEYVKAECASLAAQLHRLAA